MDKIKKAEGKFKHLPNPQLQSLFREAYSPCKFFGQCKEAQWKPSDGHIPRGYLGATGALEDVELIMVFSEPGHSYEDDGYDPNLSADEFIASCVSHTHSCFDEGKDQFHRNARWFIDQLYPNRGFDEQLRNVWLTEGRLCSINKEIGSTKDPTCAKHFLTQQIAMMPNAVVVAFGGKAKSYLKYLKGIGIDHIGAYALAPPGANHKPARPSWENAIAQIKSRRVR